jgi:ketosteroid isomerase-like protein
MKIHRLLTCVRLAFFSALLLTTSFAATPDELHNELRALKATYEKAINSGDLAPLETIFDAGTTGVTVDNQTFRSFAELKAIFERFQKQFPGVVYRIELKPDISLLEGDLAIATGTADEYVKTAAGEFTYSSAFTAVLRRTPGGWKLVRSQVTMDPFRNSIVLFFEQKAKVTYGLLGAALGGLLGFFVGRSRAKKRATDARPVTNG